MEKCTKGRRHFEDELGSYSTNESMIYISSDENEEMSYGWDSDWSTDTEDLIRRIETEMVSSPKLRAGKILTTGSPEDQSRLAGPSTSRIDVDITPKFGKQHFDDKRCYALAKECAKKRFDLCKTIIPVADSRLSVPPHERGLIFKTPLAPFAQLSSAEFRVSYHVQKTAPYENVSTKRYTSCIVCGRSADAIKREKTDDYIRRSLKGVSTHTLLNCRRKST